MKEIITRRNKGILLAVLAIILLMVAYWLISPLFINKQASETLIDLMPPEEQEAKIEMLKYGNFEGLAGHNAQGMATLLKIGEKYYVRLEDDFTVTNGPDLFVHFGKDGEYDASARLGGLKGNIGGQNYEVPTGLDPENYNEVWIWCRSFSVPFGKAMLK